jgi:hypothetical protein
MTERRGACLGRDGVADRAGLLNQVDGFHTNLKFVTVALDI